MTPTELVKYFTETEGFTHASGFQALSAEPDHVRLAVAKKPELTQFHGYFHGGVISALADHAAGGAAATLLDANRMTVTVSLQVSFLNPANGDRLVADAKTLKTGSTISVVAVDVYTEASGEETLCATATVTLRSVPLVT